VCPEAVTVNAYLPGEAEVVERIEETPGIFTLRLRLADAEAHRAYQFAPGQFNMVYLYGVGEVPISIVSDPEDDELLDHTIRVVGRVTRGLAQLRAGDRIGIRGPYGRGWPLERAAGRDVVVVTGGLGCAPVVSVINYIVRRRAQFRRLVIIQGVKHSDDLIWRDRYQDWALLDNTQVLLAADVARPDWPGYVGRVTNLLQHARFDVNDCTVMMCGPEIMMRFTAQELRKRGVAAESLWLSMERNMQCAVGSCGHCQYGPDFICRDGPVFNYPRVAPLFGVRGF
jgi:sulfhydrogenase subunit gamma (sulfur reductase)